jgi:signal transduction histidine kinase
MLGHELRNPVGAISNCVNILRSDALDDKQRAFAAGVIERQSLHLGRLIDDLLDVGRAMTGKIALQRAPLDLAASVRHAISAIDATGRLAERKVEVALAPAWLLGDATRVEQIAANLLTNAATHTSRGGRIRIEVGTEEGEAVLRVSDDGAGIAADHLPRLFELFFQADTTIDRVRGGLGIGLTLVERLTVLHGGHVHATSPGRGHGASFTVRFPALADVVDLADGRLPRTEKIPSE